MDEVIDSLLKIDFNKELKKVSIFERCENLSNNNNNNNNKCINCNKNANYLCLIDNKYYCWYHTITYK
jgi:hypothetical protein